LQESRFAEKVRDRERENFAAANHRHAGAPAPEDHARNQTQPFCAADEVMWRPAGRRQDDSLGRESGEPEFELTLVLRLRRACPTTKNATIIVFDSITPPRVPSPRRCYKNAGLPATNCDSRDQRVTKR